MWEFKRLYYFCIFVALWGTVLLLPYPEASYAEENQQHWIKITEDIQVFMEATNKELGYIHTGNTVFVTGDLSSDKVMISIGGMDGYFYNEGGFTHLISSSDEAVLEPYPKPLESKENLGKLNLHNHLSVTADPESETSSLFTLTNPFEVMYYEENNDYFITDIAGRKGFIPKTLAERLSEDNLDIKEEASTSDHSLETDNTTNGDVGAEQQEDVKIDSEDTVAPTAQFVPEDKYFKVVVEELIIYDNSTGKLIPVGTLHKGEVYPRLRDYGNWHEISFGGRKGYVWKYSTEPADDKGLLNLSKTNRTELFEVKTATDTTVYDNSSGNLVPYAVLKSGISYPVLKDYGANWYEVEVAGRIGYIKKREVLRDFGDTDRYFKVTKEQLTVYDNSSGELEPVGTLVKGEVYSRIRDYGNWHEISFGAKKGYVWKGSTVPAVNTIAHESKASASYVLDITTIRDTVVYDNSTGSLIPFAVIKSDQSYPVIRDYGINWYEVAISGRIGYIKKRDVKRGFTTQDRYFKVTTDDLTIYDNRTGALVPVGSLEKGEVYKRLRDYGNWHEIAFGRIKGYVWKASTEPANAALLKNEAKSTSISYLEVKATEETIVYDNSSGSLVPFAIIKSGQNYPVIRDYGPNWYEVKLAGRIGYIKKKSVQRGFLASDKYFKVTLDELTVYDNSNGKLVEVGHLKQGQIYQRLRDYGNWHEISFGGRKGYVWKYSTEPSASITNRAKSGTPVHFKALTDLTVYDNSTGSLIPFAVIKSGINYAIVRDYGANWFEIELSGRTGYVKKRETTIVYQSIVNPKQIYSYEDLRRDIAYLKLSYPDLIQTKVIGHSVDGRAIYAIKLGNGETEISLNGAHHAREHISVNLIMEMIDEYARSYKLNEYIGGYHVKPILDQTSMWFVPMVNPDGVTLVQRGYKSARNPAEVLKLNNGSYDFTAWKANIRGVDLNRQYPADWNQIQDDLGVPGSSHYKGTRPLSEPEAKALYDFTLAHSFKVTVAYHTAGEIIFWHYGQKGKEYDRDYALARKLGGITGYSLIPPSSNPSGGGYKDWVIQERMKPSFTIELAPYPGPRPVSIAEFDDIWRRNRTVALLLAKEAVLY